MTGKHPIHIRELLPPPFQSLELPPAGLNTNNSSSLLVLSKRTPALRDHGWNGGWTATG